MIEESLKQTDIHNKLYLAYDFLRDAKGKNEDVLRDVKFQLEEALETAEML